MISAFLLLIVSGSRSDFCNTDILATNRYTSTQIVELESSAESLRMEWNGDSVRRSIALEEAASEAWIEIKEFERSADCLRRVSQSHLVLGRVKEAIAALDKVSTLDQKYSSAEQHIKTLALQSMALLRLGKIDQASSFSRQAVNRSKHLNNADSSAWAYYARGLVEYEEYNFREAIKTQDKALAYWSGIDDLDGQAKVFLELAFARMTNDEFAIALENAEKSLQFAISAGNRQVTALARIAVGIMKSKLGKKQEALRIFLESERQFPEGVNAIEKGDMFNYLAKIYSDFDELDLAESYHSKALDIYRNEGNLFAELALLPKLGMMKFSNGHKEPGLAFFELGFTLARRLKSDFHLAVLDQDLGALYLQHDLAKALCHSQKALTSFEKIGIHQQFPLIQNRIGIIHQRRGEFLLARQFFQKSLQFSRESKNKVVETEALQHLAEISFGEGNLDAALNEVTESVALTETLHEDLGNAALRRTYFSAVHDRYELLINILMQRHKESPFGGFDIQALQAADRARARILLDTLRFAESSDAFQSNSNGNLYTKISELNVTLNLKTDALSRLLSNGGNETEIKELDSDILRIETQLGQERLALQRENPMYSVLSNPQPIEMEDFAIKHLGSDSVLLQYALGNDESYLWVVSKSEVSSFVLPAREQIESRIEKLRSLLNQGSMLPNEAVDVFQKRVADAEAEYLREARTLSNELLGQAADKLTGKRLIVVADGKIHYFPLAALPFPNSASDDPILLTNEVVYEPSAAALMIIKKISASGKVPEKDLFLVSDPVYSKIDDRLEQNGGPNTGFVATVLGNFRSFDSLESLPRLPASLEEAKSITDVVGSAATTGHTGFEANRENILNAGIGDYKVIHFATHGLLDEKRPELSGIALSLFDEAGKQQDGGFIRLQDVYGMDLNADLVVLSACDTGLGKEIKGEGLMSLNNAFLQAGAQSVVSSLWRVDDSVTKVLMTDFYRGIVSGNLTSSEALRQAQIKLRSDPRFSSPFYWASFTAQGNFNTAPQLSRSYNSWIFAVGIGLISLCGIYWLRRSRNRKSG